MFSLIQSIRQIPFACVDVETTGASADFGHRVIEVGIVRYENGVQVAEYQQLIDPCRSVSRAITALTGISPEMLMTQPRFGDQMPAMMRLLEGAAVIGHNIRFDLAFLQKEFRSVGLNMSQSLGAQVPVFDTVRIARRMFGRGGNALQKLSRRLGILPTTAHRALADAVTTMQVFERMLTPVGGWDLMLCDLMGHQGGPMSLDPINAKQSELPFELQEALDARKPVIMEYLDARQARTRRLIDPIQIKRFQGELILLAHCHLRNERRTFKVDRIVAFLPNDGTAEVTAPAEDQIVENKLHELFIAPVQISQGNDPVE